MNKQEFLEQHKRQKTFVMIKPDGVARGLVGEILSVFEKKGLKVVAMKMMKPNREQFQKHYPVQDKERITRLGQKSLLGFEGFDVDPAEYLGTTDPYELGQRVVERLMNYVLSGPVIPLVIEGLQAVEMVRKSIGSTLPNKAENGTIRATYSIDTPMIGNMEERALHNLIHASETVEEAKKEIALRFDENEIVDYQNADEVYAYSKYY